MFSGISTRLISTIPTVSAESAVNVRLVEVKTGKILCSKSLPRYVYPPNTPVAVGDMLEERFQTLYVIKLADEIGASIRTTHTKSGADNDVSWMK